MSEIYTCPACKKLVGMAGVCDKCKEGHRKRLDMINCFEAIEKADFWNVAGQLKNFKAYVDLKNILGVKQ